MNRFTKIILERIKTGQLAIKVALSPVRLQYLTKYGKSVVEIFQIVDKHGKNTKSSTIEEIAKNLKYNPILKKLITQGNYLIIIDENSQVTDKKESTWNFTVIDMDKAGFTVQIDQKKIGDMPIESEYPYFNWLDSNELANVGYTSVISTDQYDKLKNLKIGPQTVETKSKYGCQSGNCENGFGVFNIWHKGKKGDNTTPLDKNGMQFHASYAGEFSNGTANGKGTWMLGKLKTAHLTVKEQ